MESPKLLSCHEASALLGVGVPRLRRLSEKLWIPGAVKINERWLYKRSVLESWLAGEASDEAGPRPPLTASTGRISHG